jgi:hypothetical protein
LSTRPELRLGDEDLWDKAEKALEEALNKFGKPWNIDIKDFDSPIKRKKFEIKSRKLHIDHLKIAESLAELDNLEILKKGLNTAQ